jgi:hypothetical protein
VIEIFQSKEIIWRTFQKAKQAPSLKAGSLEFKLELAG